MNKICIMVCFIVGSVSAQTITIGPLAKGLPSFSVASTPNSEHNNLISLGGFAKPHIFDLFLPIDFSLHVLYGKKVIFDKEPSIVQTPGGTFTSTGFTRSISNLEIGVPVTYQIASSVINVEVGIYFAFDNFTVTEVTQPIDPGGNFVNRSENESSKTRFGLWPVAEFSIPVVSPLSLALFTEYRLSEFTFDFPEPSTQTGVIRYDATYKLKGFQLGAAVCYSF